MRPDLKHKYNKAGENESAAADGQGPGNSDAATDNQAQ